MTFFSLFRNRLSYFGLFLIILFTAVGLPMMFIDIFTHGTNPYTGIFIYGVAPGISAVGLLIALLGAWFQARKRKRHPKMTLPPLPIIDLNQKSQRFLIGFICLGILIFLSLISATAYNAYKFSDSTEFCGMTCHEVMKPEFTAFQHSAHARVGCVECHIGEGVNWFVKSKITGSYQVYSVLFDKFHRPIETPIKDLRPAQETCERCHWPAKFYDSQQKTFQHYFADEANTPWQIQMLLKIGGGDPEMGKAEGIHWHMNIQNKIEYMATDEKRLNIPWVRSTSPNGKVTEYISTENPITSAEMNQHEIRRMDCLDCHNRPSHIFRPPFFAIDQAFRNGNLDPELPYLKREAVRLFSDPYGTEAEALEAIETGLYTFYQENYPDLMESKSDSLKKATASLKRLFSINIFPEMKADWRAYPDHLSHVTSDGCFRCHDGQHVSNSGEVISNDCNSCHTILAQGPPDEVAKAKLETQPFQHPIDLGMDVTDFKCTMCHAQGEGI